MRGTDKRWQSDIIAADRTLPEIAEDMHGARCGATLMALCDK